MLNKFIDSDRGAKVKKSKSSSSSSSGSDSSSSSGSDSLSSGTSSDSDSGSSGSSSSSEDSSSSDSESSSTPSSPSPKKVKKMKKIKAKPTKATSGSTGSTSSSATLVGDKDIKPKKETDSLLVADSSSNIGTKVLPATKQNVKQLKKDQTPFSRIPTDQAIDPKFSSNKYVSYDYADRAYQDLSVTKGKGFTKEKNKKKRGTSNTSRQQPAKPAWKRRLEREYAGLLDDLDPDFMDDGDFDDYNPLGFKDDTFDFMSGCGFNPMGGGW